jgi:hypothetical protein
MSASLKAEVVPMPDLSGASLRRFCQGVDLPDPSEGVGFECGGAQRIGEVRGRLGKGFSVRRPLLGAPSPGSAQGCDSRRQDAENADQ